MLGLAAGAKLNANKDLANNIGKIRLCGAHGVRRYLNFGSVEEVMGSGNYDFSREDAVIQALFDAGIPVLIGISARMDGHALDLDRVTAMCKFATAAVKRYGSEELVLGFEGPNEVMLGRNSSKGGKYDTNPTPARFVSMQKTLYVACKNADPTVLVGSGSIIGDDSYVEECYHAGLAGSFDFLCYHPYTHDISPTESLKTHRGGFYSMFQARHHMVEFGDAAKPVWVTEYGASSKQRGFAGQVHDLTDGYHHFNKQPWAGPFFWFDGWDTQESNDPGDSMGLYDVNGLKKSVCDRFEQLAVW